MESISISSSKELQNVKGLSEAKVARLKEAGVVCGPHA